MAAADTVEVRRPIVTIPGVATDSIVYTASLSIDRAFGQAPAIKYSSHNAGSDRVESPTSNELIQKVAQAQQLMFQPPTTNVVNILDGAGNFAMFTGYDTGPSHLVMFGRVNNGKNIVHRCSRLEFLNTTIYRPDDKKPTAEAIEVLADAANPCAALKIVLQELIKEFLATREDEEGTTDFEIRNKIHEANTKILEEEWYPALDASTESDIPHFAEASANPAIQLVMYRSIRSVYLSGAVDFSTVISQFGAMFQMTFVPGHMGTTIGKFIPMSKKLADPEEKEVNIVELAMSPGPRTFLSTTAVAVRGAPNTDVPPVGQATRPAGYNMITWPETLPDAGQTIVIQMPSWLPEDLYPLEISKTGTNLDFDANLQQVKTAQQEIVDAGIIVEKVCLDIARLVYNDVSLKYSSATINCPLDVTWEAGKRYSIKQPSTTSGGSSVLFSGFLLSVEHRVNCSPASAQAVTQLTFSHVEANGFTLPNK